MKETLPSGAETVPSIVMREAVMLIEPPMGAASLTFSGKRMSPSWFLMVKLPKPESLMSSGESTTRAFLSWRNSRGFPLASTANGSADVRLRLGLKVTTGGVGEWMGKFTYRVSLASKETDMELRGGGVDRWFSPTVVLPIKLPSRAIEGAEMLRFPPAAPWVYPTS